MGFATGLTAGANLGFNYQDRKRRAAMDQRTEERLVKQENDIELMKRTEEYARRIEGVLGSDPNRSLDDIFSDPRNAQAYVDITNEYPDVALNRPGGIGELTGIHRTEGGYAAAAKVKDPKTGEVLSEGVLTADGQNREDSPLALANTAGDLMNPVHANLNYLRGKSKSFHDFQTGRERDQLQAGYLRQLGGVGQPEAPSTQHVAPSAPPPAAGLQAAQAPQSVAPSATHEAPSATSQFAYNGPQYGPELDDAISGIAEANGVPAALVKAVIQQESAGDPNAQSPTGASGLMQITQPAVDEVNRIYGTDYTREQMRTDPAANMDVGTKYLAHLMKQYNGNVEQALAAYNGGPGHLQQAGGDYRNTKEETRNYVPAVMRHLAGAQAPGAPEGQTGQATSVLAEGDVEGFGPAQPPTLASAARGGRNGRNANTPSAAEMSQPAAGRSGGNTYGFQVADGRHGRNATGPAAQAQAAQVAEAPAPARVSKRDTVKVAVDNAPPPPSTPAEAKDVQKTAESIKPARKLTQKQVDAVIALHQLDPKAVPLDTVFRAVTTGRLTKADIETKITAAGDIIQIDKTTGQVTNAGVAPGLAQQAALKYQTDVNKYKSDADKAKITGIKDVVDLIIPADSKGYKAGDRAALSAQIGTTMQTLGIDPSSPEGRTAMIQAVAQHKAYVKNNDGFMGIGADDRKFSSLTPFIIAAHMGTSPENVVRGMIDPVQAKLTGGAKLSDGSQMKVLNYINQLMTQHNYSQEQAINYVAQLLNAENEKGS